MGRRRSDIERYLKGEMTPSEMHALEREALNDPFLAEALEGATQAGADSFLFDVKELRASFKRRARPRKVKIISMWNWSLGIAAGLVLMAVTSIYIISTINQRPGTETMASREATPGQEQAASSDSATDQDTQAPVVSEDTKSSETALKKIQGRVISVAGSPLPGVNVLLKGTSQGAVTNANGGYSIAVGEEARTLLFTYPGLKDAEATVQAQMNAIELQADPTQQSKMVVAGTGSFSNTSQVFRFAEPRGGREAFEKYLVSEKRYPDQAVRKKTKGNVTVQFTVTDQGELKDFTILAGIGDGCDGEVIRLIKEGPRWTPSQLDGKPVTDQVKVILKF